jgi:hypothetical protein
MENAEGKKQYRVVTAVDLEVQGEKRRYWNRVGTAWENAPSKEGARPYINLRLSAVPVSGEVWLFEDTGRKPEPQSVDTPF